MHLSATIVTVLLSAFIATAAPFSKANHDDNLSPDKCTTGYKCDNKLQSRTYTQSEPNALGADIPNPAKDSPPGRGGHNHSKDQTKKRSIVTSQNTHPGHGPPPPPPPPPSLQPPGRGGYNSPSKARAVTEKFDALGPVKRQHRPTDGTDGRGAYQRSATESTLDSTSAREEPNSRAVKNSLSSHGGPHGDTDGRGGHNKRAAEPDTSDYAVHGNNKSGKPGRKGNGTDGRGGYSPSATKRKVEDSTAVEDVALGRGGYNHEPSKRDIDDATAVAGEEDVALGRGGYNHEP
ncbi:hypothetical protein BT63DRAFT_423284 [Microthyrium microscopicum]|uniref:Pal1-domain-containing protein n=1 Tax=Microthyrium microscopicum TaxID=703497 RepID=A0A6A6UFG6_9PEZI|nr:hypothetical protein BT63DRAFT_423284 [Microthyrium microscopicum]